MSWSLLIFILRHFLPSGGQNSGKGNQPGARPFQMLQLLCTGGQQCRKDFHGISSLYHVCFIETREENIGEISRSGGCLSCDPTIATGAGDNNPISLTHQAVYCLMYSSLQVSCINLSVLKTHKHITINT